MNSIELSSALTRLRGVKTKGVFPSDKVPRLYPPADVIINTDPHFRPGEHWVALWISKNGDGIFFDSYGRPLANKCFLRRIKKYCKTFKCNKMKIQSDFSSVCGEFSFMFLSMMLRGYSLKKFCKLFSNDCTRNDKIASKFYSNSMRKNKRKNRRPKPYYARGFGQVKYNQCCKPAKA